MASVRTESGIYLKDTGPGVWTGSHEIGAHVYWWTGVEVLVDDDGDQVGVTPEAHQILREIRAMVGAYFGVLRTERAADMDLVLVLLPEQCG